MTHEPTSDVRPDRGRIPGPRGLELWRFLGRFRDRPFDRLLDLALEYGDIVMLDFPAERVVILANPDYVEHVLHHRHQLYDKQTPNWKSVRQIWGYGLLTSDGDVWRRQRQRMQPAFHQEAMKGFAAMVVEEARRISDIWAVSAAHGEARDVYQDMLVCAIRAISRAAFGSDIEGQHDVVIKALDEINHYINPMALPNLMRVPQTVQRLLNPEYRRFRRAYATINRILRDIVTRRLLASRDRGDLLGMIMYATDDETSQPMTAAQLHDEMINILMAGHETTGIATAWCWYWLSQNPDVERELHAEVDRVLAGRLPGYDDLPNLPYTKMVFQEAMRLTPPVWGLDRRAKEDDRIDGYRIPRGTYVAISPYLMHRHPKYWDMPEQFRPARFSAEAVAGRPQYAYLPFGGGPRRCIGMRFALLEGQLILALLAQSFSVRLKPGQKVVPEARLNLPPKYGVQMFLEPRRAAAVSPAAV